MSTSAVVRIPSDPKPRIVGWRRLGEYVKHRRCLALGEFSAAGSQVEIMHAVKQKTQVMRLHESATKSATCSRMHTVAIALRESRVFCSQQRGEYGFAMHRSAMLEGAADVPTERTASRFLLRPKVATAAGLITFTTAAPLRSGTGFPIEGHDKL